MEAGGKKKIQQDKLKDPFWTFVNKKKDPKAKVKGQQLRSIKDTSNSYSNKYS